MLLAGLLLLGCAGQSAPDPQPAASSALPETTGPATAPTTTSGPEPTTPPGAGDPTTEDPTTGQQPGTPPDRRPNILVIETDDMRADELRWMPRTRRLVGKHGLTFHNSFAGDPLCCPSRASFLTGRLPRNHGVLSHEEPYGFRSFDDSDTLATQLQEVGYRTALVGKYLNGYGEQPTRDGDDSLLYVPPGWNQWYAASDHLWQPGEPPGGHTYDYFQLTSNLNGHIRSWPGEYNTRVTADQVRALINRFADKKAPWFLWWTPVAPHHGGPREADDPGGVRRADGWEVDYVTPARPDWVKGRFDGRIVDPPSPRRVWRERDVADKPRYLRRTPPPTEQERQTLVEVARQRAESLYALDVHVGRTLRALAATEDADETIVVFTSDNGYYLGEHRKRQGKINLHEPSIRVPLLLRGPGIEPGQRLDPVSTVDLAVTLAAYAGASLMAPDGSDLRGMVAEGDRGWTRPVLLEGRMTEDRYARAGDLRMGGLSTTGLRLGRWKVVRYATGETELYDLARDPLELRSLGGEKYAEHRRRLLRLLKRYAECAGVSCRKALPDDLRVAPEQNRRITRRQLQAARSD